MKDDNFSAARLFRQVSAVIIALVCLPFIATYETIEFIAFAISESTRKPKSTPKG
jgi:uncharacterized membrane protein